MVFKGWVVVLLGRLMVVIMLQLVYCWWKCMSCLVILIYCVKERDKDDG